MADTLRDLLPVAPMKGQDIAGTKGRRQGNGAGKLHGRFRIPEQKEVPAGLFGPNGMIMVPECLRNPVFLLLHVFFMYIGCSRPTLPALLRNIHLTPSRLQSSDSF